MGVGIAVLPVISFAQIDINTSYALSNELGIEIIPNYPRPNEMVFINLTLYTDDLNSADITWHQDGKAVLSGRGKVNYSFKAGPIGKETKIEIKINLLSGASFSKAFTLNPASIDLVWEANSYAPPFYKGKALHSRQGNLKIVAMPEFVKNGRRVASENLIYEWSNGVDVYQNQNGYGKSVLILNGSILGQTDKIEVLVTDPINNLVAEAFLDVSPSDPEIVFYRNDPYYGLIFDTAIVGSFDLKSEEVQIFAAPYYFTKKDAGSLKYEWQLNSQTAPSLSGSRTAIFRKPENEAGRSAVSLGVENPNRILQQADGSLMINFSK